MRTLKIKLGQGGLESVWRYPFLDASNEGFRLDPVNDLNADRLRRLIVLTRPDRLVMPHPTTGKPDTHTVIWNPDGTYALAHDTSEVAS